MFTSAPKTQPLFSSPDEVSHALANLPKTDEGQRAAARARQKDLTKPPGALGRLEDIAVFMAGWSKAGRPSADRVRAVVFAGNHGVTAQGVSPYPPEVTAQMVANFNAGGAAINAIAGTLGIELDVVPLSLDQPTADIATGPAMSTPGALDAFNTGARHVPDDIDLLVLGEMGIGNTTIAAALCAAAIGGDGARWSGPGTGLNADGIANKARIVDLALSRHRAEFESTVHTTAFQTLASLGGRETAAIAGAVLAARLKRIPVILDGYVVTASIASLFVQTPDILEHCLSGHRSAEPAHSRLLEKMALKPILDLDMRLGEATGAALAVAVVRAAVATHNGMATFAEAQVANRD